MLLFQRLCKQHKNPEEVQSKHIGGSSLRPVNPERSCSGDVLGISCQDECNDFKHVWCLWQENRQQRCRSWVSDKARRTQDVKESR